MNTARTLKLFFCFRKPVVLKLSYINVLIESKPCLLIAWDMNRVRFVKFSSLKNRHYSANKAMLITIPADKTELTMNVSNFWRTTKVLLPMRFVELDKAALSELIAGFRPLNKIDVGTPVISSVTTGLTVEPVREPELIKVISLYNGFNINIQSFNYP